MDDQALLSGFLRTLGLLRENHGCIHRRSVELGEEASALIDMSCGDRITC
jgi:hypothetical protein